MMKITKKITQTIVALSAFLLLALPAQSAEGATSCSFDAQIKTGSENKTTIGMDGSVISSNGRLRIETVHPLTMESIILIADFDKDKALMLYPDTLNGFSGKLSSFDDSGYLGLMKGFVESGKVETPKGWKKSTIGDEKLGGKSVKHYRMTTAGGKTIDYWSNSEGQIVKISSGNAKGTVAIDFKNYNAKASAQDSLFSHTKDYTITEISDPDMLLGVSL